MQADIILRGQQPNLLNTLALSDAAAQRKVEYGRRNALAATLQEHGPGIMAGNQNALAAYAQHDPAAALAVRNTQDANSRADRELQMKVAQFKAGLSAAQAAEEAEKIRQGVFAATAAQSPEQWDQIVMQFGQDHLVGQFANKDAHLRMYMSAAEILEADESVAPLSAPGKVQADIDAGILSPDTPLRNETPLVSFTKDTAQSSTTLPPAPDANVPAGSGRDAFGLGGLVKSAVNGVTDFVAGQEVFEEVGENVRFFRNMEEDLLVGLSQAYGRQPAQALMERLRALLPNVGTTEGAQAAYRELAQMRSRFERDLSAARVNARQARTASKQQEFAAKVIGFESAIDQIDEGIRRLAPPETSTQGISPDVAERMKAYEDE